MNVRLGKSKFHSLGLLLGSVAIYSIILVKFTKKYKRKIPSLSVGVHK